jgi:hypothetical protein
MRVALISLIVFGLGVAIVSGQEDETAAIQEVVESFYADYLVQLQSEIAHGTGSPLIEGAYRSSPYLTPGWIANVDNTLATIENGATLIDPFILAQDVPERVEVEVTEVWADGAETLVRQYFSGDPFSHNITVLLNNRDGWKIDYVVDGENVTPAGVVDAYYTWYLGYVQPDAHGNVANPLTDRAYGFSPYLTERLIAEIDGMVRGSDALGADPFLQAQDVPGSFTVEAISSTDTDATVLLHGWFAGNPDSHDVLLLLTRGADFWQINRVSADIPPEAVAARFYNGYIAYRRYDIEQDSGRRPLVDWASGLESSLNDEVRDTLTGIFAGGDALMVDPVLCAQDLPQRVDAVVVDATDAHAAVRMDALYPAGEGSYDHYPLTIVDLSQVDGEWLVSGIACAR